MFCQCAIKGVLCHLLSFKSCQQEVNWATNTVIECNYSLNVCFPTCIQAPNHWKWFKVSPWKQMICSHGSFKILVWMLWYFWNKVVKRHRAGEGLGSSESRQVSAAKSCDLAPQSNLMGLKSLLSLLITFTFFIGYKKSSQLTVMTLLSLYWK